MIRPTLHLLAGPNGAGKTTLYETRLKDLLIGIEFVNADLLALQHYGHPAETREEAETGQGLAEARRRTLMTERLSFITESTFSHSSKVKLVRDAKAAGYRVVLYHVHVVSPDLAVLRVQARVGEGGHPVPEAKIRERYARNQDLIHQAALIADHTFVFDNSRLEQPHRRILSIKNGGLVAPSEQIPLWAQTLYAAELAGMPPDNSNQR